MFEHSVKVPRHFKIASNIFKKVSTEGGSVKTLLYDDKLKHFRTNVLYALITETIKHAGDIDRIFENSGILVNEPRLDPWLAKVLTAELLFGKKALPGKSKPEQTILSYKEQFEKFTSENPDDVKSKVVRRPRYVRINTNLLTTSDAIRAFQDEGYKFIRCTSGSYDDYLKQIQTLTQYDFSQDYHVKTVFVFASGTKLHEHDLYLSNQIILQDKATALAVHLLSPPSGSVVLDMCAAPGMKTTQLAAFLRNQGKIYAVERNENRYATLCDFVKSTASKCVETIHKDALEIKRGDMDDVEYILLDPSCSGSGMELCVHNYIEETRLAKLTSLQEKFLKHAMNAFPKAKRIVYSTCSLYPEENERVVTNVVKTSRAKWRVQDVKELLKGHWNNFGSGMYGSMGTRCLYAKPESDMTTGFFLAVLDKEQKDSDKYQSEEIESVDLKVKNKKKHEINEKDSSNDVVDTEIMLTQVHNETDVKIKKKKIHEIIEKHSSNDEVDTEIMLTHVHNETDVKKKKKKKHEINEAKSSNDVVDTEIMLTHVHNETDVKIKKKKKRKEKHCSDITENSPEIPEINLENSTEDNIEIKKKKRKKSKSGDDHLVAVVNDVPKKDELQGDSAEEISLKEKKNKNKDEEIIAPDNSANNAELEDISIDTTIESKKKKKKKHSQQDIESVEDIPRKRKHKSDDSHSTVCF